MSAPWGRSSRSRGASYAAGRTKDLRGGGGYAIPADSRPRKVTAVQVDGVVRSNWPPGAS